ARPLDIVTDRRHELLERVEAALLADRAPQLDDEPLVVEIAVEVEQVRLHPALDAVEVRIGADRDRSPTVARPARVHAVRRDEELVRDVEVCGREPELPSAAVPSNDDSLDLGRATEQRRRPLYLPRTQELPHPARGDVLDERHRSHIEAELREKVE